MRILIVEDNLDILELLGYILTTQRYEVKKATGSHDALRLVRHWRPDLIITDFELDEDWLNGLQLIARLKTYWPELPGILISATEVEEFYPADVFLLKPFGVKEVRNAIEIAIQTASYAISSV
jgi:DNA-binding response OmpR family regulator